MHRIVDLGRPHIQSPPEDKGETQHVVDLIGKIRPARGDDGIRRHRAHGIGQDFRRRVGKGKDNGARGHFGDHVRRQNARTGKAKEQIRPRNHIGQRGGCRALGIGGLLVGHLIGAALIDQPRKITEPNILALNAQFQQHVQTGNPRRPTAGRDDLDVREFLARDMQRIGRRRPHHNCRAMLIVMEHRDLHPLTAQLFNDETIWRFDVLKVDRAKGRLQRADDLGQLIGVRFVQLDVKAIDVGEFLEQNGLAFHHGL